MIPSSSFFVIRAPLLPLDTLLEWASSLTAAAAPDPEARAAALAADKACLREAYRTLLSSPLVREAIFVASPDLDRAIDEWWRNPESDRGQGAERALTRYLTRMASRATPFGLFGSTAVAVPGANTNLPVAPPTGCQRHTRLDVDYLVMLVESLCREPKIRSHLRFRPNDSLYRAAGSWRFLEIRLKDRIRSHHLVSVLSSDALDAALARARAGATRDELLSTVMNLDIGRANAVSFVDEMIEARVVEPDLVCPVTGPEPLEAIALRLRDIPPAATVAAALRDVATRIAAIDALTAGGPTEGYREVARLLDQLPAKADIARLFQTDLVRPPGSTLAQETLALIGQGVALLHELQPPAVDLELETFHRAWSERYGERAVPLAEALDSDIGLGSALGPGTRGMSVLLDGLDFPPPPRESLEWGTRERRLLDLAGRALAAGAHEICLTDDDRRELRSAVQRPLPDSYAAVATLVGRGSKPPHVLMHAVSGPSGARLLGRFCHGDPELASRVREHLRTEEALDPDAIYAEVAHLPEGRVGNVILRPVLREYEIPFLGASGADVGHQIAVTDLTVQLLDGRFILRSIALGRRIVPRVTNAHNFGRWAVGIYRFLCLLQGDGYTEFTAWSWGPLASLPFLPRVRVGDVVLSRATWRVTKSDIAAIATTGMEQRWTTIQQWRQARRLPRWVVLADGDNTLPVDFENVLAVDSFVQLLKDRDEATLTEFFPGLDELVARGPDGAYAHELVVPFTRTPGVVRTATPERSSPREPATGTQVVQRIFPPGSDWVFAKLYGGSGVADTVLGEAVGPLSRRLMDEGAIDQWFFIRYADPDEHLRWRLHVPGGASASRVRGRIERTMRELINQGLVRRAGFDTYEREIERYGGPEAIGIAEQWFWADSECTLDLLGVVADSDAAAAVRWRAGVLNVDRLLSDLGLDLAGKQRVMRKAREAFGAEFHVDPAFRRALADKLRPVARELEQLLTEGPARQTPLAVADRAFIRRRRRSRAGLRRLQVLASKGRLFASVEGLAPSYVHMTLNRLFRSEPRMHELVLYDFLDQIYARRLVRKSRDE